MTDAEPNRGGRPAKRLVDHITQRTFQPKRHGNMLLGEDIPIRPPHADPTPAMKRLWARLRDLQHEYRDADGAEVRRDIILTFSRTADEYVDAVDRAKRDPAKELDGLGDIIAVNRRARNARLRTPRIPKTMGPYVGRFFGNFRHTKGPTAGKPFTFDAWQQHDIDLIYELTPKGRRRWRTVLWGVSRGNGKSPIVGGLGIVEAASREDEPEVYTAGVDRAGAKIITGFQSSFITGSRLIDFCDVLKNTITYRPTGAVIQTMSGDGYRAHGLSPSAALKDEKHAWITDKQVELHNALASAMHKRFDSVEIDITTAGWDLSTLLGEQYEANMQTMDLEILEDGFLIIGRDVEAQALMIWRGAPEDADPADPKVWRKANPASWLDDAELRRMSLTLPENVFRRLILNQWTESLSRWLPIGAWEGLRAEREVERKTPIVLVFAGTYQRDSAALVACTIEDMPHVMTLGLWEAPRNADGWIVPVDQVDKAVRRALRTFDVESFVVDLPGWEDEYDDWLERYGAVVEAPLEKNRRAQMVTWASRYVSKIATHEVTHDGNRQLSTQLARVVAKETPEGSVITRPLDAERKPARGKFIDGAVCAVIAVGIATDDTGSVYDTRGLITLDGGPDDVGDPDYVTTMIEGEPVRVPRKRRAA